MFVPVLPRVYNVVQDHPGLLDGATLAEAVEARHTDSVHGQSASEFAEILCQGSRSAGQVSRLPATMSCSTALDATATHQEQRWPSKSLKEDCQAQHAPTPRRLLQNGPPARLIVTG